MNAAALRRALQSAVKGARRSTIGRAAVGRGMSQGELAGLTAIPVAATAGAAPLGTMLRQQSLTGEWSAPEEGAIDRYMEQSVEDPDARIDWREDALIRREKRRNAELRRMLRERMNSGRHGFSDLQGELRRAEEEGRYDPKVEQVDRFNRGTGGY